MRPSSSTRSLLILVAVVAAVIVLRFVSPWISPPLLELLGGDVLNTLNSPWFHLGPKSGQQQAPGIDVTPILLIQAGLFLVLLTIGARVGRRFLHTRILSRTHLDPGQQYSLANIFGYVVFVFGLAIGLQTAGLNLSSLTVLGGAVGLGIGFGLQAIANNFISGLVLLIERPIKVGDRIEAGTAAGIVMRIGTRSTWIRSSNDAVIIVPNSELVTGRVTNWSVIHQRGRCVVTIGALHGTDPEQVRSLLVGVGRAHPAILQDPAPDVVVTGVVDGVIRFELTAWTENQAPTGHITSDLYCGVLKTFREHGVEVALPQRDLHLRTAPDTLATGR